MLKEERSFFSIVLLASKIYLSKSINNNFEITKNKGPLGPLTNNEGKTKAFYSGRILFYNARTTASACYPDLLLYPELTHV